MREQRRLRIARQLEELAAALLIGLTATLAFGIGCAPSPEQGTESGNGSAFGTTSRGMQVGLVDTTARQGNGPKTIALQEANVVIDKVTAHAAGGWVTLREDVTVAVDVLRLGDFAVDLGFGDLPSGKVTQIRLHVDIDGTPPFVVTPDGTEVPLKVPSGYQSGIKVKGLWDVGACDQLSVDLDLDGKKSIWIHPTGRGDLYVLRPVIRAGRTGRSAIDGCDASTPGDTDDEDDDSDAPGNAPNAPGNPNHPNSGQGGNDDPSGGLSGDPDDANDGEPDSGPAGGDDDTTSGTPSDDATGSGDPADGDGTSGTPGDGDSIGGDPSGDTTAPGDNPDGSGSGGAPDGDGSGTGIPNGSPCMMNSECNIGAFCSEDGFCTAL